MRNRLLIVLLSWIPLFAAAQEPTATAPPTSGLAFGLLAHTFGFGFDVQYHVLRPEWKYTVGLSMSSYKNLRELKIRSAYADEGGKEYIYDKLNYCYVLAPTLGLSRSLVSRNIFNRVGLRGGISAGPLLAFLKPYFVNVATPINGNQALVEPKRYDPTKYNYSNIYGVGDYFLGMDEISLVPGARIKATATVDLSSGTAYIRAVELGLFADVFAKRLPMFGLTANQQTYLGGSVEILIGNNW
jgi:hypothetical protein